LQGLPAPDSGPDALAEAGEVRRALAGDEAAFDALVKRYERPVRALLFRLSGSAEDAEDLAQETFIRVYTHLRTFRGGSGLKTWIFRIATNLALDQMRRRRRRPVMKPLESSGTVRMLGAYMQGPDAGLARRERADAVGHALNGLPHQQRAALLLKVMEGMNYEEIAGVLGTTAGSVKSSIHLARRKMMNVVGNLLP
jgi:RNA polymerase sigma-70 factor (ECF subfamily)